MRQLKVTGSVVLNTVSYRSNLLLDFGAQPPHCPAHGAPLRPACSVARGPYLNHMKGHKLGIPRCVLGRGRPLDPGAGCPIPHFGDADGGVFFFVEVPH